MSFWNVMNWAAWGMCGIIFLLIMNDFIKVERKTGSKK